MKTINLNDFASAGTNISEFAKQLIGLLNSIHNIRTYNLTRANAIKLLEDTAKKMRANVGCWISNLTDPTILAMQAGEITQIVGKFNDIDIIVDEKSTVESIIEYYHYESNKSAEAYRNSPKGKADALRMKRETENMQVKADALMRELLTLDFKDNLEILNWLCKIAEPADRIDVSVPKSKIVKTFNDHGFFAGVNTGSAFNEDDEDNFARYIIGQGLRCLEVVGPIHLVSDFTDKWKKKFNKVTV